MWWRVCIVVVVAFLLASARSEKSWNNLWLTKILNFFGFEKGEKLDPTEQIGHFCFGIISLPFLHLLGDIFGFNFIINQIFSNISLPVQCFIAALVTGLVKETGDTIIGGLDLPDSFKDICFWLLGGLVSPLLNVYVHV